MKLHTLICIWITVLIVAGGCQSSGRKQDLGNAQESDPTGRWLEIVETARWAQNAHNMQSWRFHVEPGGALIGGLEPERLLPETDPLARQLILSLGALSEAARVAALQQGLVLKAEWIAPEEWSVASDPGAELFRWTLTPTDRSDSVDDAIDALSAPTVKYAVEPYFFEGGDVTNLIERHTRPGIRWQVDVGTRRVSETRRLAIEAYEIEMTHEPTLMESYNNTQIGLRSRRERPYGITLLGNFSRPAIGLVELLGSLFPQSPEQYAESGIDMFHQAIAGDPMLFVLTTTENSPEAQFEAGKPLQALWADVIARGGSLLPLSQGLQEYPEVASHFEELHELWARPGETVQMVMSLGAPRGNFKQSPRIPTAELFQ